MLLWPLYSDTYNEREKAKAAKKKSKAPATSSSDMPEQTKDVDVMTAIRNNICPQCLLRFGFLNTGIVSLLL